MSKKFTYEFVKSEFEKEGYTLLSTEYKDNRTKLYYICPIGHRWSITYGSFASGRRCNFCAIDYKANKRKLTYESVKKQFEKRGYTLLSQTYKNSHTKLKYMCDNKHIRLIAYNSFQQGHGCSICATKLNSERQRFSYDYIKSIFNKENYTLLSENYINANQKLDFICPNNHKGSITYGDFKSGYRCRWCYLEKNSGKNHYYWKGGVTELNLPVYNTYAHRINWCEETRRDPENNVLLQVKCTESSCRKWFTPTMKQICHRIGALNSEDGFENRLYCSDECKGNCSIYHKKNYPKGFKHDYYREVQSELRDMVLERDEYMCQRCWAKDKLQCHHYESIYFNPIMSADIEMCVTLCKKCHKLAHGEVGCRPIDLTRESLCKTAKAKGEKP